MEQRTSLTEIIEYIDPGSLSYQDWVNVGMALKLEGYPVSVWDQWSQKDFGRYHAGECEKKWRSFSGSSSPVTGGTIVQMAMERGWVPEKGHELDWNDSIQVDSDRVVVDKNWLEGREIQEPKNWNPAEQLITYLETLFEAGENVGYVTGSWEKTDENQATGRCSVKGSKFWFNCNPDGPYHWFKVNWINKATGYLGKEQVRKIRQKAKAEGKDPGLKELLYLHFTMDDNLSLDEEVKARYRSMYIGVFFKRYILGLWAAAEGVIYDMFDEARHVRDIKDFFQLLINGNRYVSCDYGTQNATVFLLWNKGRDGVWYCIREYYYSGRDKGRQKTDSEYADDLKKWLDGTKIKAIIVDPSAASFIAELRKRGYKVLKANNDVLDGIRLVGMLLNLELLKFASSCTETIKEFASYIWDEKALERGEDKPVKQHDHSCDAVRYFVSSLLMPSLPFMAHCSLMRTSQAQMRKTRTLRR